MPSNFITQEPQEICIGRCSQIEHIDRYIVNAPGSVAAHAAAVAAAAVAVTMDPAAAIHDWNR
jgi:hypothetical protein